MGAREVYHITKKPRDIFWNTYVCRPIAAVIVDKIKNSAVTPNQVTLAGFVLAIVSAGLLVALPGYSGLVTAIVVFELSYVLDCVDGMLARFRGTQSSSGHLLDFLMDEIKALALLAAACVRLALDQADLRWLFVGVAGLFCLAGGIAITTFQRRPEIAGVLAEKQDSGARDDSPKPRSLVASAIRVVESVGKFFIHYPSYILFAALSGYLEAYVLPYVAINALYFVKSLGWVFLKFGRRPAR